MVFSGPADHEQDQTSRVIRRQLEQGRGEFAFDPEDFREEAKGFSVDQYRLPEEGLVEYGKLASRLRKQFQAKAVVMQEAMAADLA